MRKTFRKLLAAALVLIMLLTLLPLQSFAAHSHTNEETAMTATRSISAGTYVLAANVNGTYYALPNSFAMTNGKILGEQITLTNGTVSDTVAANYSVTIAASGTNFTIYNGTSYLKYSSGTNLSTATTAYEWTISAGTNGSYRIVSAATTSRGIVFRAGSYNQFGGYAVSNATATSTEYYDVELLPISTGGDSGDTGGDTTESVVSTVNIENGQYVIAANVDGTYYAMSTTFGAKVTGTAITVTDGTVAQEDAAAYAVTITAVGSYYTIQSGSSYLSYVSSTNLGSSTTAYNWALIEGVNGTYRAVASTDNTRGLIFQKTTEYTRFGGYSLSNVTAGAIGYFDIEILPIADGGTTDTPTAPLIEDGDYVIAAHINGTYYAMGNYFSEKINGTGITVSNGCVTTENATDYVVSIAANGDYYTIKNATGYLRYVSGTNLGYSASTAYDWSITAGTNGSYRISAASTLSATTVRALAYRAEDYHTFGGYAASNIANQPDNYFDVELLPVGDPADYVKTTFTLVSASSQMTAGDYVIISQAINSNNAFYAMTTSQEPGYYYMTSDLLPNTTLPQSITLYAKDLADYVWTMTGSRTSFTMKNSSGSYLANSASAARLNLSTTATTWAASAYSTTKHGFHFKANNYYISLRDDSTTTGANGYPMFGGVAVTTSPAGHIYLNLYKACSHSSVSTQAIPQTCIESGASTTTCDSCGEVISWTSYPATGHSIVYSPDTETTHLISCETCGYEEGTENCIYSNLACYLCGNAEPENDYSGRYYFAAVRSAASSTYHYMTFDLVGSSTRRYASEDSGLTTLPSVITAPVSNKVYVIEKNEAGTYRIFAEGLAGDNCLAWEVDANASENSGAFADTFNAYELTIGLSGEAGDGNKIVNIYFVENELPRYLSLNNTTGNNYFAWYTNASSQRKDIVLLPVEGEATCLHTNRTTVVTEPTCLANGVEMIYCADCGVVVGENELLASGHALQYQWIEEGWHYVTCANCDYSLTEECTLVGEACVYCSGGDLECFQLVTSAADLTTDRYIIIAQATQGDYVGNYTYYGVGLQQDSNHNALSSFGMNFDTLPTEIYLEGSDTANLVWNLTGSASGFTLTTDSSKSLYHNTGNDLFLGSYTATTWTADFSTTEGHFAVKHDSAYYLSLRTDWDTLDDTDVYSPLVNCVNNTNTGNYKMFFFKKYDGCLHQNTNTTLVEPTCTKAGSEVVICLDCNQVITSETLEAYGHDPAAFEATEATCEVSGNLAYWYCADCDTYFSDELCSKTTTQEAIAIPALGHSWDDGQITTSPTCTAEGVMTYTCYVCTGTKTEAIAAAGHFYTRVITAPTCTAQGYTTHTCTGCGDSYISNYTDPFGHLYSYVNNNNGTHLASCTRGCGYSVTEDCVFENGTCVCGATEVEECAHSSTKSVVTNATCTTAGSVAVICNTCGQTISTTVIAATGHTITEVAAKAPTCTENGFNKHWYCASCGTYFADAAGNYSLPASFAVIAPTGHSIVYTNNGSTHTITCSNGCSYSITEGHTYAEDNTCVCGAVYSNEPTYELDPNLSFTMDISVGAEMTVSYTLMGSIVNSYEDFYLQVTKDVAGGDPVVTTYGITEDREAMTVKYHPTTGEAVLYQATYKGIYAKEMGDNFSTVLYAVASDGTIHYSATSISSIKDYLVEKINASGSIAELKTMAVDMLKYGAAAQIRLSYNTDNLVTDDLTQAQLAYGTQTIPEAVDKTATAGSGNALNASISVTSRVLLNLSCVYTVSDSSNLKFVVMDATEGEILAELPATVAGGVFCKGVFDEVGAKQMRRTITVTLFDNGLPVSQMLTWSVESYVAQVRAKSNVTADELNMVNAMLTYGDAVAAYMTAIGK
ncbi:MAG: hypothetical protein E7434_01300 [Ruminococcaceae bacterium]|nr:hypothetical protein [Oscillospiraceae bacterium]